MKILTYKYQGHEAVGIVCDGGINILPVSVLGIDAKNVKSGDTVECIIEGIGTLKNTVK